MSKSKSKKGRGLTPRLFRLPKRVWDALDKDAKACLRSRERQLEARLTQFYGLGDVEMHFDKALSKQEHSDSPIPESARKSSKPRTPGPIGSGKKAQGG